MHDHEEPSLISLSSATGQVRQFERVRFGEERDGWTNGLASCHDWGVVRGELHIALCDAEECPQCRGQLLSCECGADEATKPACQSS